jgi:hypothetical protein
MPTQESSKEKSSKEKTCEYCELGSKPWINGNGYWMHEGGVGCQTPEKNCTCHLGSVCGIACDRGLHHDGCNHFTLN